MQLPIVASSIVSLYFLELTDLFKPAKVGFQCYDRALSMPYVDTSEELIPLLMLLSLAFAAPAASVSPNVQGHGTALRPTRWDSAEHLPVGRSWWARACCTACSHGCGDADGARTGPRVASTLLVATSTPSCGALYALWVSCWPAPQSCPNPCPRVGCRPPALP